MAAVENALQIQDVLPMLPTAQSLDTAGPSLDTLTEGLDRPQIRMLENAFPIRVAPSGPLTARNLDFAKRLHNMELADRQRLVEEAVVVEDAGKNSA